MTVIPKKRRTKTSNDKYRQVANQIRTTILDGHLVPGDRIPSFAQLQEEFDATPSTINRALITLEQEALISRQPGRGVFVAQPPTIKRHNVIGFMGFPIENCQASRYWMDLLQGVQEIAGQSGHGLLITGSGIEVTTKVDGLLIHSDLGLSLAQDLPVPAVSAGVAIEGMTSVCADEFSAGMLAANHLIELGHRKIACTIHSHQRTGNLRMAGYFAALHQAGIHPEKGWLRYLNLVPSDSVLEMGRVNMLKWIQDGWAEMGCTGIVAQNDHTAMGIINALNEVDIRVPEDVSVIGFDSTSDCDLSTPRLTSVKIPLHDIGAFATRLLLQAIEGHATPTGTFLLPVGLDNRDSTAPPFRR